MTWTFGARCSRTLSSLAERHYYQVIDSLFVCSVLLILALGLEKRLNDELVAMVPPTMRVKAVAPPDRKVSAGSPYLVVVCISRVLLQ